MEMRPGEIVEAGAALAMLQDARAPLAVEPRGGGAMQTLERSIDLAARSSLSIVLYGETGVGKEVFAERIHARSSRNAGPLVKINCAAVPENLLETELFGYERGAFTGATQAKPGLLEAADGGTLFLDEIGEMPLALQSKLLRVLEAREVRRVGALRPEPIDVRLVTATHRDLPRAVADGTFRSDLYFRINGATFRIPALRERRNEIIPLAESFLEAAAKHEGIAPAPLSESTRAALLSHGWPGNVRELKNVIERALVFCGGRAIEPEHLQLVAPSAPGSQPTGSSGLWDETHQRERARIVAALESTHGNQTAAAKLLGIARRTLINRMHEYGIERKRD
jgi:transcriptional regulator with PAS, ATPase and Fis domain